MALLAKRLALSLTVFAALVFGAELYLRSKDYGAIPSVWFDPAIGTRFHPNQTRRIYGPKMTFLSEAKINAQGFRGGDFDDPAAKRDLRIACVGDSFTFGWGVEDGESFPARLQARLDGAPELPRWQVLNFGMPGYSTWQELQLYQRVARAEAPRVVVVVWYINDLDPFSIGATGTLTPEDHPLAGTALFDWYVRKLRPIKPVYRFDDPEIEAGRELKDFYDRNTELFETDSSDPRTRPYVERNLDHLGRLFTAIEADGAKPVLLVFPCTRQVLALKEVAAGSPEQRAAVEAKAVRVLDDLAAFAAGRGVLHVSMLADFVAADPWPYGEREVTHPSVHGHQLAADRLFSALRDAGYLQ